MDTHRTRSLGAAAIALMLICLAAAALRGVVPVLADGVAAANLIEINGDTATVSVNLYKDANHNTALGSDAVLSTDTLYGAFSAVFMAESRPTADKYTAVYTFPETINVKDNYGGDLLNGTGSAATKAGTWRIEKNKLFFTFDTEWLQQHPSDVYVAADFAFTLANQNTGSGNSTKVDFPGAGEIEIVSKDGDVTGTKEGKFSQDANGTAKVVWRVKLKVESYATNAVLNDTLGNNFSFVAGSFKLDGKQLDPQPTIDGQNVNADLGNLSQGEHVLTYETLLKLDVSANNAEYINKQDGSKNTAGWTWGDSDDRRTGSVTAAPGDFRYDMVNKSDGTGSPSDIAWTVKLNQGELKADMSGYVFTDTLDSKQTYTGDYEVYKGASGTELLEKGKLDSSKKSFTYTFPTDLADKYETYRIVYHTKMNDTDSYDTVRNTAKVDGSVSGSDEGAFSPQLVGSPITKKLVSAKDAATTGRATWETSVALKAIVNAVNPDKVTVKDTFQSAWKQNIGVDADSIVITIGSTELVRDTDWKLTNNQQGVSNKRNFDLDIIVNEKVKNALKNEDYAVIRYDTRSDALSGWYSNFASVSADGLNLQRQYTDPIVYVVNQEATPSVEKPENETTVSWDGNFDWNAVDGTSEKGAWIVDWTVYANRVKTSEDECYGAGKLNGQPLKIIDKLPDGMAYVPGFAVYSLFQNPYDKHTNYYDGDKNEIVADGVELGDDGVRRAGDTVTFTVPTKALGSCAGYAKLVYRTAVKRSTLDTSKNETKLTNSARAESGDKNFETGSGTVTIKNNVLLKTGSQVANSNRIKYTILVNESALDLKNDSDFLELVDVMDAQCALVPSSVKVYQHKDEGWNLLGSDEYTVGAETIKDDSGAACTKMTLSVPDGSHLKVQYEVIPAGNAGETVSLTNKASLTGVWDGEEVHSKEWEIQKASGSAGGNGYGVTVTKVDKSDIAKKLSGAKFVLYKVDMNKAITAGVDAAKTVFQEVSTGDSGTATFGTADQKMEAYTLYCLEEIQAPEGYNVIDRPMWIMLKGQNEQQYQEALAKVEALKQADAAVGAPTANTDITVYDAPYSGKATISATKVLQGSSLKEGQFSFVLKDANGKVLQTAKNGADGDISFNLDYSKAGTYEYTICEAVPEGAVNNVKDHIAYDATEHRATAKVENGDGELKVTVTYDGVSATPPTFTNTYSTTLPAAGGPGLTMTYLAGASLLCFVATWIHARRQRDMNRGERCG
ncbi:Spy0128 family protein [Collinsella aerofaciens]|uniref:Spy0128 family protein n=1 Tax=Collinsella aerofaciens TaxID=74426 RepID=UPI00359C23A0